MLNTYTILTLNPPVFEFLQALYLSLYGDERLSAELIGAKSKSVTKEGRKEEIIPRVVSCKSL